MADKQDGPSLAGIPLSSVSELLERIIAPTTLLVALAYHFGRRFTTARAAYFGIDASLLDLSTQEYVLRSAEAFIVPLGTAFLVALAGLQAHSWLSAVLGRDKYRPRVLLLSHVLIIVGAILAAVGVYGVFVPLPLHYLIGPLLPAIGLILVAYGSHWRPRTLLPPAMAAVRKLLVGGVIVLSLFWASSVYAAALGTGRASLTAENLQSLPRAIVLSKTPLGLSGPGVTVQQVASHGSGYDYRYDGLRLLIRTGDHLFLLPTGWTRSQGTVVMLTQTNDLRFEFRP